MRVRLPISTEIAKTPTVFHDTTEVHQAESDSPKYPDRIEVIEEDHQTAKSDSPTYPVRNDVIAQVHQTESDAPKRQRPHRQLLLGRSPPPLQGNIQRTSIFPLKPTTMMPDVQ